MPDNKLKDNEIIKAQEYCCEEDGCDRSCPLFDKCKSPIKTMEDFIKFDLDLINRLQAEIEVCNEALDNSMKLNNRLQSQNKDLAETVHNLTIEKDALFDKAEELKAEVERLKEFIVETRRCDKEIKVEAYKECIEKIKNYIKTHCNPYGKPDFDYDTSIKILNFIDNLLKELVGEEK